MSRVRSHIVILKSWFSGEKSRKVNLFLNEIKTT